MRLSRSGSAVRRKKDQKLGNLRTKKKHKRLDAICEKTYSRNHSGVVRDQGNDLDVEGSQGELRRSTRVRKAPVLLDASPPPPKKRQKIDKRSGLNSVVRIKREEKIDSRQPNSPVLEEESGGWRSRLRSRAKSVSFRVKEKGHQSPNGKRRLFHDFDGLQDRVKLDNGEFHGEEEAHISGKSTIVRSKRPGRVKASNISANEIQEINDDLVLKNDKGIQENEILEAPGEGISLHVESNEEHHRDDEGGENEGALSQFIDDNRNEGGTVARLEEIHSSKHVVALEHDNDVVEEEELEKDQQEASEPGVMEDHEKGSGTHDKLVEDKGVEDFEKPRNASDGARNLGSVKEGRRCGLCGGGTDGKPPKKLVQDGAISENEIHSGSSSSEEPNYDVLDGFGEEPGWLGRLLGPINDRFGIAGIWVHQQCAVWSPEVYFAGLGCLKNVRTALCRGRALKCSRCGRSGATIGCRVDRCPKTYHLPCARSDGCIFDQRKFLIACTDHRHLFQPHGRRYMRRLKKMKTKKLKMEIRKMSFDAWRRDIDAEEKWLENCGEDEEFLRRESRRLQRDLLRIQPVYIGGPKSDDDDGTQFQGWECVAGLQDVIQCMKEVVLLPLLYPEFFSSIGLTPPRGVLLHGYPGTGKTLVVRALIGSCARGNKRIAYFARKGADCLGKYVGDAERQLRLLFQVAEKSQPSVIFFDEIDGLAPCRTRQQDQTHNSVVSTLLALMDGLKSRGSVVVIGATNRPDAVDPALRRPGRFDREIYFPLPSVADREAILSLHTKNWPKPVSGSLLKSLASRTVGFAGADLQALCTQAAISALKRNFPLHEYLNAASSKSDNSKSPPLPAFTVEERDWLEALLHAPPPCSRREAGMAANDVVASPLPTHLLPSLLHQLTKLLVSLHLEERVCLPPALSKAVTLVKNVILSALGKKRRQSSNWWLDVDDLLQDADVASEIQNSLSSINTLVNSGYSGPVEDGYVDDSSRSEPFKAQQLGGRRGLVRNISFVSEKTGFRLLISGNPRSGQRHLVSCLLHCFIGNAEVQKVDLATLSQEGNGDVVQGLTQMLTRCSSVGRCVIFMPRVDLWAVNEENDMASVCSSSEKEIFDFRKEEEIGSTARATDRAELQDTVKTVTNLWNLFVDQVESVCLSTPVTIMATSEIPIDLLPLKIRRFFRTEAPACSVLALSDDRVPRFSIELGGNFNCSVEIDSSAVKLATDLARLFVQLIYSRNHKHHFSSEGGRVCGTEADVQMHCPREDFNSTVENGGKELPLHPTSTSLPNSKVLKGRSNLMLTICNFGYQILRYPHFAELCWVTSKLRDGPCAEITGPWKGWPFNSCIIRPIKSNKKASVACSGNVKSKEKLGCVRGLIAVGLSAYKGEYSSLKEVSSEVRKVLELLVGQIDSKIQAGKERCQYLRIQSQVAYLDDMVNSWVYTLQGSETDAQQSESSFNRDFKGLNCQNDSKLSGDACKLEAVNKSLDIEIQGHSAQGDSSNRSDHSNLDSNSPIIDGRVLVVESGMDSVSVVPPDNEALNCSNGFPDEDSVHLYDGSGSDRSKLFCNLGEDSKRDNGSCLAEANICHAKGIQKSPGHSFKISNSSKKSVNLGTDPDILCSFWCCKKCLFSLVQLLKDILEREWKLKEGNGTVEDLHDLVSSLSMNLHSAVLKLSLPDSYNSFDEKEVLHKCKRFMDILENDLSGCEESRKSVIVPVNCDCHTDGTPTTEEYYSHDLHNVLDIKFMFRDGVLTTTDSFKDGSLHCNFGELCLCSLIEWILMKKGLKTD